MSSTGIILCECTEVYNILNQVSSLRAISESLKLNDTTEGGLRAVHKIPAINRPLS